MKCKHIIENILSLIIIFLKIANGDVCYGAEFSEDVTACPDFENEQMKCDSLQLGIVEGKEAELGLNGIIRVTTDIEDGITMDAEIWKVLDIGKEFIYHMKGDLCSNLKNENSPLYPMTQSMNISDCPIPSKKYNIKDMIISLNNTKDMLTHETCGEYIIELSLSKDLDKVACYELAVNVMESEC